MSYCCPWMNSFGWSYKFSWKVYLWHNHRATYRYLLEVFVRWSQFLFQFLAQQNVAAFYLQQPRYPSSLFIICDVRWRSCQKGRLLMWRMCFVRHFRSPTWPSTSLKQRVSWLCCLWLGQLGGFDLIKPVQCPSAHKKFFRFERNVVHTGRAVTK